LKVELPLKDEAKTDRSTEESEADSHSVGR
jgi:hypothetical protein